MFDMTTAPPGKQVRLVYLHESVWTGVGRVAGLQNVQLLFTEDGPGPAGGTSTLNTVLDGQGYV
jgi:hypothetical protein